MPLSVLRAVSGLIWAAEDSNVSTPAPTGVLARSTKPVETSWWVVARRATVKL